jgi:hypothetical protein
MRCSALAVAVLMTMPALGGPELLSAKGIRHGVYDWTTGRLMPGPVERDLGESIWKCAEDTGWFYDSHAYGWIVLDWGDIHPGREPDRVHVGGFSFGYATDLMMPHRIDAIVFFYADDDGYNTYTRVAMAGYVFPNLPTGTGPESNSWIITLDLESAGGFYLQGNDLDGDELIDFSYTYWFRNLPGGATGPLLAYDPNVSPPLAPGAEDVFDAYTDPNLSAGSYVGSYSLGGDPFAQFFLEVFAMANDFSGGDYCRYPGDSGKYCEADIWPNTGDGLWDYAVDGDCQIRLADLAQLLSKYGMTAYATREDGDVEPPWGGDGDVDLGDLAEVLGQYGDDCQAP